MRFVFGKGKYAIPVLAALLGYVALPRWYAHSIPQPRSDADTFHRLVWLNNWIDAAALLERTSPRPAVDPLLAQAVMLRGNLEKIALPMAGAEIAAIIEKAGANDHPAVLLQLLSIKGDIEFQLDLSRAEATWMQVQEVAKKAGLPEWKARANGELGAIAFLKGQPIRALNLVARAYLAAELNGDVAAQIRYRTALGEGLAEFGRNDDSLQFFQRALDLADSTPGAYFPFTAFVGKARILATTGRSDQAMKMLREGLLESRARGFGIREARLLTTLSDLAEKRGDKSEALVWLKQAAALAERAGLRRIESTAATRLSRLHREIGNKTGAARYARQSVHAARLSGDAYHLPQLLAELAESEAAIGNVREADATFERATDFVVDLLSDLAQAADRNTLTATMGRVFEGHLRLALQQKDFEKAFRIVESARGRAIADLLIHSRHLPAVLQSPTALNRSLAHESDPRRRADLLDRLWESEVRSYRVQDPAAVHTRQAATTMSVSLRDFQRGLPAEVVLIHYVLGHESSIALAVTRDQVDSYQLADRATIETEVDRLNASLARYDPDFDSARKLHRLLIEPVKLANGRRRLLIVPDGRLHLAPFEAFIDEQQHYAIESRIISYVPSATVLNLVRGSREKSRGDRMLAVGGAQYAATAGGVDPQIFRSQSLFDRSSPFRWTALPQSAKEAADIAAITGGDTALLTGARATEGALKALPLSRFRSLHFAIHTAIDQEFPRRSALLFPQAAGETDDGFLQASEILSLPLDADLVTLSSCEAGAGQPEGIAGMDTLVQSFLLAGARSVVASVWAAEDTFTAELMRNFYRNLRHGLDKAEALTVAKRQLIATYGPNAQPYYWAGFRLFGDASGKTTGGHTYAATREGRPGRSTGNNGHDR